MRIAVLCACLASILLTGGCRSMELGSRFADGGASPADKDEVVAIVNRNVTGGDGRGGLISWRSMHAKFQMAPLPVAAPGTIIVEAPRNFRLRVSHPLGGGDELDVGSNTSEFWIWQKAMNPPYLLTSHHEDMPLALQHFKVPFQPDWIMEVLGVIPIDGSQYQIHPSSQRNVVELTTTAQSPGGEPMRKVIRVDTRKGYVTEHLLWDHAGRLVASAELDGHRIEAGSQIAMPRKLRIQWPEADLDLRITLERVEVNPPHLPDLVWQVPQKPGFKQLDMGDFARRQAAASGVLPAGHMSTPAAVSGPAASGPAVDSYGSGAATINPGGAVGGEPPPFPTSPTNGAWGANPAPGGTGSSGTATGAAVSGTGAGGPSDPFDSSGRIRLDSLGP